MNRTYHQKCIILTQHPSTLDLCCWPAGFGRRKICLLPGTVTVDMKSVTLTLEAIGKEVDVADPDSCVALTCSDSEGRVWKCGRGAGGGGAGGIVCRILGSREIHTGSLGASLNFIVFNLAILMLQLMSYLLNSIAKYF